MLQVAWVRVDTQTILSIHHNVITQNPRITLSFNDHRSWYLHIKKVEEVDRGWYMCQINTDPMRSLQGYLEVVGECVRSFTFIIDPNSSEGTFSKCGGQKSFCKIAGSEKLHHS